MLVNALNMSTKLKGIIRETIDNSNWRMDFFNLMFDWKDLVVEDDMIIMILSVVDNHGPISVSKSSN